MKKRLFDIYRITPPPPEENVKELYDYLERQVNIGNNLLEITNKLGMVSYKMSMITIFVHKHFKQKLKAKKAGKLNLHLITLVPMPVIS